MLKLKFQYFGHLMQRIDSLEKTMMLGKIEGGGDNRGWDSWMASPTQSTCVEQTPGNGEGQGSLACCSQWESDTTEQANHSTPVPTLPMPLPKPSSSCRLTCAFTVSDLSFVACYSNPWQLSSPLPSSVDLLTERVCEQDRSHNLLQPFLRSDSLILLSHSAC